MLANLYPKQCCSRGFSLVELALVLVIMGVMVGVTISSFRQPVESASITATVNRLQVIKEALRAYKDQNGRLPCPADQTLLKTDANYGVENGTAGTCTGGNVFSASGVVEGGVPFVALGLPSKYTFDGWGRRIAYAVYAEATRNNAFLYYGINTTSSSGIDVQDASGSNRNASTNKYLYLVMSYGKNGHGAYIEDGTRYSAGSTNTSEQVNCHCNSSAAATAYNTSYVDREATYNSASATDSFDDIVLYESFSHLHAKTDDNVKGALPIATTQSISTPDATTNANFAGSVALGDVNGDGYADLVLGMPNGDNGGANTGSIFLVYGTPRGIPQDWVLSTTNVKTIVRFDGSAVGMKIGTTVAAGDVNNDGYADIISSAINGANYEVYVVYGKPSYASATNTITQGGGGSFIDGTNGFALVSTYFSNPNAIMVGNINGDSIGDIVIASSAYNSGGVYGTVVALFGRVVGWSSANTVDAAFFKNGRIGFLVSSTTDISLGASVAVGNVNADSYNDLIIGAPGADNGFANSGSVFVIYGKNSNWQSSYTEASLATINTAIPVKAWGTITFTANPTAGHTITLNGVVWTFVAAGAAGNQTNRGATLTATLASLYTDLTASANGSLTIASYSVAGGTANAALKITCKTNDTACDAYTLASSNGNGVVSAADLTDYTTVAPSAPPTGLRFDGPVASTGLGSAVAVGDVNGDGKTDLIMGASTYSTNDGAVFVVFGTSTWTSFANTVNAAFLNAGAVGTRFDPVLASATRFGYSLAVADIDSNGYADIFAPTYTGGSNEAYIIYGRSSYAAANYTLETTSPFDTVNGTTLLKYTSAITSTRQSPSIGDINADGYPDMVFGTPTYNAGDGRAYLFYGQPYGWRTTTITY